VYNSINFRYKYKEPSLADKEKKSKPKTKEHPLTSWLKLKFRGKGEGTGPVDTQFLTDLSDIKTIGRYEILSQIGKGSMGVVYL
jgi:hypothetical protein